MERELDFFRGINLGGWLVLEPWITPSLFAGTNCPDEYSLCQYLGLKGEAVLDDFRDSFIDQKDFEWIARQGLNSVRLPVGYWILEDQKPYISTTAYVDKAMDWAERYGLAVVFSLHGAPGSQNGKNHSGKAGNVGWHKNAENIRLTLQVIETIATRYKHSPCLAGIELLNEPHWKVPRRILKKYYEDAYKLIRSHLGNDVMVIINDHYKPGFWKNFSKKRGYKNLVIDRHLYQAYSKKDQKRDLASVIRKTKGWEKGISRAQIRAPIIIGEWSVALSHSSRAVRADGKDKVRPIYADAQIRAFSNSRGWFYWTYKTEDTGPWNFRAIYEKGWIKPIV